jgi:hypothetical protein
MKKLLFGTMFLALVIIVPISTMAQVDIRVSFPLPPPIVFAAPPQVIVLPDTYVYVDPDIDVDLYFYGGFWWRFWEGRWYRSRYYNRGWGYYNTIPTWYFDIDPGWRGYYSSRDWYGHRWNYERIPYSRVQTNWSTWEKNRYWERQRTWGVQNYQPRPTQQRQELRQQRQQQYLQKPEVQRHQEQIQKQPKAQVQQPKAQVQPKAQEKVQQPQKQPQVQQPKAQVQQPKQQPQEKVQQPQHSQPQGKPEGGEVEHKK